MLFRGNPTARAAIVSIVVGLAVVLSGGTVMAKHPFKQRIDVGPLPEKLSWINTAKPPRLEELRGKFVLLDFWTYCCINCMHILPELKKLERAYPNNLVVIGVHSAKFGAERGTKNVTEAVLRYKIEHPVINDPEHILWKRFGVRSWPTLLLIDPEGKAVWGKGGETSFEQLDKLLKKALPYYRGRKLLDEKPLRFELESARAAKTPLRFPGKVLVDEATDRLFIADSGHNRIVIARTDGTLLDTIGSGRIGSDDGDYASARFKDPQGMALAGEILYVADTSNHLIRKIDLKEGRVRTIAGTGKQLRGLSRVKVSRVPLKTEIASPWALWVDGDWLYIAMAGPHQIWRMALDESRIGPYAGNGREDIVDGPLLPAKPYELGYSSFAQPSGLASDGKWLYVADSEGSSIRMVPLDGQKSKGSKAPKVVKTLVGTADLPRARLFTFGDVDGPASKVRLQHALGIAYHDGRIFVADTYNNKIKTIDPATGTTETLAGSGKPGDSDDPATFDEPAGLAAAGAKLYVADTNNHLVRVIDLNAANRVSTLAIPTLKPPHANTGGRQ